MFINEQYPIPFTKLASLDRWQEKPLLKRHLKAHQEFVKKHLNDTAVKWRKVLWLDETKIELFDLNSKLHLTQA